MPKYANDPEESEIIKSYDLLASRFRGIYGGEPKYFIRSPASCAVVGSASSTVGLIVASMNCLQNVVIAIANNSHGRIRINHYQNAVYGEKVFETDSVKWKFD